MSLQKMPQPPDVECYIDWPQPATPFIIRPNAPLVTTEARHWAGRYQAEQIGLDERAIEVCAMMLTGLYTAIDDSTRLHEVAAKEAKLDPVTAVKTHLGCVMTLAFSRLWREIGVEDPPHVRFNRRDLLTDFYPNFLFFSGLHAKDGPLRTLLEIDRPKLDEPVWFEADSLYVQASSPAVPSPPADYKYRQLYGRNLPVQEYTTIRPRLKNEAWLILPIS